MLDDEMKEVLGELINISFGSAAAAIADLFDSFATLHVPNIKLMSLDEVKTDLFARADLGDIYISSQQFKGQFLGESCFIIDGDGARSIASLIDEDGDDVAEEGYPDDCEVQENVLEIANILGTACVGKLSEMLSAEVTFNPPVIETVKQFLQGVKQEPYSQIIVIGTTLEFRDMQFTGRLLIMLNDKMFAWLDGALNSFLES